MNNDGIDFARVENGALAGRFVAQFWQPIALSREVTAGRARRVKFLGTFYTLYRGEDGAVRMTQDRCPHRGTSLAYGWVEGNDIRCRYHGWKFGPDGQGVEFPAETKSYAARVCLKTYPVREYLGAIFCFVGEGEAPEFPVFPELEDEGRGTLMTRAVVLPYNYYQRVENDHDEVHTLFTHRDAFKQYGLDQIPEMTAKETEYGMIVVSTRSDGKKRVGYGFMPNILLREVPVREDATKMSIHLAWRVPIDDTTTFSLMISRVANFDANLGVVGKDVEDQATIVARILRGEMTVDDIDQRHPQLAVIQDTVSLCGQGVIVDRSAENLGRSDKAIALYRRIWTREMNAIRDGLPAKVWKRPDDFRYGKEIEGAELLGAEA